MSPARAILLHSPGRKPWVNYWNIFIEPQRGGTTERINSDTSAVVPHNTMVSNFDALALDTFTASASKYLNYTKRKQGLRFLFSKPQRSLYKLQLKFVQTTAEVCTDYS